MNPMFSRINRSALMVSSSGNAESDDSPASAEKALADSETIRLEDEESGDDDEDFDMPWSDVQDWALRDNLAKFTVVLPASITGGRPKKYAMWRTLTREVPELAGYPIPFLLRKHQLSLTKDASKSSSNNTMIEETPAVLPMVDDFEFASNGGIVGSTYGLLGVADGTRIQTPTLISVEKNVPLGYVTTQEAGDKSSSK